MIYSWGKNVYVYVWLETHDTLLIDIVITCALLVVR
jgi:hypothetical protein